jgi:protein involved in polysaccharide export with SLBB domain
MPTVDQWLLARWQALAARQMVGNPAKSHLGSAFALLLSPSFQRRGITSIRGAALCLFMMLTGCAALTNPVANGIPVQRMPPELLGESKNAMESLPVSALRQAPPVEYLLGAGDVLGIWIEGILGEKGQAPPVQHSEGSKLAPAIGFPIPIRSNGTIALPFVDPIKLQGKTLEQAEEAIRKSYTVDKKIIQPGRERIYVTLQKPRQYHILVIRQDSGSDTAATASFSNNATGFVIAPGGSTPGVRSGKGYSIDLPAYENDVLNALARTGGFPGSDAVNEIIIERGAFRGGQERADILKKLQGSPNGAFIDGEDHVIRIPLRFRKGEYPMIAPESVILQTGDVVYIGARQSDVFFTGGLLPPRQFVLPRDVDLDVVEAIIQAGGAINSGGLSALNVSGTTLPPGVGAPSPALVMVLRRTPQGGQVNIRVDLDRALRDPRERILIQPKDIVLMQEMPQQAITRYFSTAFNYSIAYQLLNSSRASSATSLSGP